MAAIVGIRSASLAAMLAVASLGACDATVSPRGSFEPFSSPPPANIIDELVRTTVRATGLEAPFDVLDIRDGPFDELRGLTPEAQAAGSIIPYATGRRSLARRVWRVRLIATDAAAACTGDPCSLPRIYVEAFLDSETRTVIGIVTGPIPSGLVSPAP